MSSEQPRKIIDCPHDGDRLPAGRVIRAHDDRYGITLDGCLYGDVYYCACGPNLFHLEPVGGAG